MTTETRNTKDVISFTEIAQEHFKQVTESASALGVRLALGGHWNPGSAEHPGAADALGILFHGRAISPVHRPISPRGRHGRSHGCASGAARRTRSGNRAADQGRHRPGSIDPKLR